MKKHLTSLLFLCLMLMPHFGIAQADSNEQVKRLQRTIFIYNLIEQVEWPETSSANSAIMIGVLGPDRTVSDLRVMAQKRRLSDKTISIKQFNTVKDISDINVLYVNNLYNYDIEYLLSRISGKQILLITEDYAFNSSMINMVNVGNSFEYEINTSRLQSEQLTWKASLEHYAVKSSEKWKKLYQNAELLRKEANAERLEQNRELLEKDTLLEMKENQLRDQVKKLDTADYLVRKQNDSILLLYAQKELSEKKYEDKVLIERELEGIISKQVAYIKLQSDSIANTALFIKSQRDTLQRQSEQIEANELILKKKNSEIKTQKTNVILISTIAGLLALVGVVFFIFYRQKKRLNDRLTKQNREIEMQAIKLATQNNELEQFAYIASHDLQEPLNTITSLIWLLKEDLQHDLNPSTQKSMDFITNSTARMRGLINALLKHSRLGLMNDATTVDCNELVSVVQQDLSEVISSKNAKVEVHDLPTVLASEVELSLIFQNLIGNAIKFCAEGVEPKVTISSERIQDVANTNQWLWKFAVADNGIGIPAAYKDKIFAIFQRLHSRESYKGTGIGLSHVKKIVEAHGGNVSVTSKEGKGSIFYFTIPDIL